VTPLRGTFQLAAGALALACAYAHAAEAGGAPAATESPGWLSPLAGVKLIAVDGSALTLSSSEGGFALALAAPNGAIRHSTFSFVSDKLGTIADDGDAGHVVGFFRETDSGLEAQFADGRTESLIANGDGGVALTLHAAGGETSCFAWYPSGHAFSATEKQAALAAYAERLGVSEHARKAARPAQTCAPAATHIARKQTPPPPAQGPYKIGMYQGGAVMSSGAAGLTQVAVRTSEVHTIDAAVAPLAAISPPAATVQPAAPVSQQLSAPPLAQVTLASAVPDGHGASDCLAIESDGANVGFRNRCAYGVQFAYCLQKASDPAADCGAGARSGAVSANGYVLLLTDTNIKSADAERDFRWVACSGGNGSVVAHLDRADPPAGRCTRGSTS
jgi:hypothetical protein